VFRLDELVLELGDPLDAFVLEGVQARVECVLFGEQLLDRGEIAAKIRRTDLRLFFR
jgi:hypothetical protein